MRHSIIIGSAGSGRTTIAKAIVNDVWRYHPYLEPTPGLFDPEALDKRYSLLILDDCLQQAVLDHLPQMEDFVQRGGRIVAQVRLPLHEVAAAFISWLQSYHAVQIIEISHDLSYEEMPVLPVSQLTAPHFIASQRPESVVLGARRFLAELSLQGAGTSAPAEEKAVFNIMLNTINAALDLAAKHYPQKRGRYHSRRKQTAD